MKQMTRLHAMGVTLLLTAGAAVAEDSQTGAVPATEVQGVDALAAFADSATLSEAELGEERAAAMLELDSITINDNNQDGLVSNNNANGNTTGGNNVNSGAFADSAGFISTIQNTGNNVLIQNSTIINVSVEQ